MPTSKKRSTIRGRVKGRLKAKRGGIKSRSRQFYSEIGTRAGRPLRKKRAKAKVRSKLARARAGLSAAQKRELLSEIKTVGRKLKRRVRRVKRAL